MTATRPKCLVEIDGRMLIERQIAALAGAGIQRVTVVTGYRHEQVAETLASPQPLDVRVRFNPFWAVASSIGSVWAVRDLLHGPFCLANGDTLFDAPGVAAALAAELPMLGLMVEPIPGASCDDMLVRVEGSRVSAVSKDLPEAEATHRSLGMILAPAGFEDYAATLDRLIAERQGIGAYHHEIVDRLARKGMVDAIECTPGASMEIDRPEDIEAWMIAHKGRASA